MKTIPVALQTHLDTGATTLAFALKITRTDGAIYGFTSAGESVTISGTTYDATQGLDISSIVTSAGFAVDNLELQTLDDGTLFTRVEVLGGLWQAAKFVIYRYNWATPSDGVEPVMAGTIGDVKLMRGMVVCELRGLQQYLQQPVGNVTSRTCRARFADYPTQAGNNRCGLTAASFIESATVSAVTSNQVFTSSSLWTATPTADYYGEGVLTWTSGNNVGLRMKVRTYESSGVITLALPMIADVQIGDAFDIIAGCRKRLAEDCITKFNNVLNFQGEPHLPGVDELTARPDVNV